MGIVIIWRGCRVKVYAGIGSRKTPITILKEIEKISKSLADNNWILRSGGAIGADTAFENGCKNSDNYTNNSNICEVFLAKPNYNDVDDYAPYTMEDWADSMDIAAKHHPVFYKLNYYIKCLHARNVMIILGADLHTPADLVIAYYNPELNSGTKFGSKLATVYGVPVVNMFEEAYNSYEKITEYINTSWI
jgi:hypothetical protein